MVLLLGGMLAVWKGSSPALPQQRTTKSDERDDKFPSEGPAPRITLSINLLSSASAREGSPLFIKAAISADHAEDRTIPFVLSKPGGRWSDFASVEIRDASGRIVSGLDMRSAYQTPASISINDNVSGTLVWIAQPAGGKLLAPGDYFVTAVLDSSSSTDANSWLGKTRSPACRLTVKPQSAPVSDAEARLAVLVEIRIHDSLKQSDAALSTADKYLAEHPKDRVILEEKGDVLASTGKFSEALAAYDAALDSIPPQPESPFREPPEGLLIKRTKAEQALLKQGPK
jgi:hypothetical protein